MQYWMRLLISLALLSIVKAHGRLILLAIMGLIGMWFTHLLAQDYQTITRPVEAVRHLLGKRSIDHMNNNKHFSEITWELILSNDPKDCVKSFLCQASADSRNLNSEERSILEMARNSKHNKIVQYISKGETVSNIAFCRKTYKRCPFDKETRVGYLHIYEFTQSRTEDFSNGNKFVPQPFNFQAKEKLNLISDTVNKSLEYFQKTLKQI